MGSYADVEELAVVVESRDTLVTLATVFGAGGYTNAAYLALKLNSFFFSRLYQLMSA